MRGRIAHPQWCWRERCTAHHRSIGEHRSRPLRLPAAGGPVSSVTTLVAGQRGCFAEMTLSVHLPGHATTTHVREVQRLLIALESTIRREIHK
jgi:hypothetical protein